jgi:uncharacterized protein (DUF1778 family)
MVAMEAIMADSERTHSMRPRISVDVSIELRRRLRLAAARRDTTVGHYVVEAIEERLAADLAREREPAFALSAASDPVLAELWDNPADAAYDRLAPR